MRISLLILSLCSACQALQASLPRREALAKLMIPAVLAPILPSNALDMDAFMSNEVSIVISTHSQQLLTCTLARFGYEKLQPQDRPEVHSSVDQGRGFVQIRAIGRCSWGSLQASQGCRWSASSTWKSGQEFGWCLCYVTATPAGYRVVKTALSPSNF